MYLYNRRSFRQGDILLQLYLQGTSYASPDILCTKLSLYIEDEYIYSELQYNRTFCGTVEKCHYAEKE